MLNWFKKRWAYMLGQNAAKMIVGEIENHISNRVIPASQSFIGVFKATLTTIWDEPPSPPDSRARLYVEWESFKEHLDEFLSHMRAELNIRTYKFDDIIGSNREHIDEYILRRIRAIELKMIDEAESLIHQANSEIKRRESDAMNGL